MAFNSEQLTREAVEATLKTLAMRTNGIAQVWETLTNPDAFKVMDCPTFTGFVRDYDLAQYAIPREVRPTLAKLMHDEGTSVRNIATLLGCSTGTVSTDLNLPKPTRKTRQPKKAQPVKLPTRYTRTPKGFTDLVKQIDALDNLPSAEEQLQIQAFLYNRLASRVAQMRAKEAEVDDPRDDVIEFLRGHI